MDALFFLSMWIVFSIRELNSFFLLHPHDPTAGRSTLANSRGHFSAYEEVVGPESGRPGYPELVFLFRGLRIKSIGSAMSCCTARWVLPYASRFCRDVAWQLLVSGITFRHGLCSFSFYETLLGSSSLTQHVCMYLFGSWQGLGHGEISHLSIGCDQLGKFGPDST